MIATSVAPVIIVMVVALLVIFALPVCLEMYMVNLSGILILLLVTAAGRQWQCALFPISRRMSPWEGCGAAGVLGGDPPFASVQHTH